MHHSQAGKPVAPATGQRDLVRVEVDQFGFMVGHAKRPRQCCVEKLPVALLGVAKPQRVVVVIGVGAAFEQTLGALWACAKPLVSRPTQSRRIVKVDRLGVMASAVGQGRWVRIIWRV